MTNKRELLDPGNAALAEALNVSFKILKVIMVLLVIAFLATGFFTLEHNEVAMVLRFGKVVGTKADRILKPGKIHWTWPWPISEVVSVPIKKQYSLKIGDFWYYKKKNKYATEAENVREGEDPGPKNLDPEKDGYCLAKDGNIMHFTGNIQYKIEDAYMYKMNHSDPKGQLHNIACNWIIKAASEYTAIDILRDNPDGLREMIKRGMQQKLDSLQLGLKIINVNIRGAIPRQVRAAFVSATDARSEHSQKITAAKTYRTKAKNESIGESARLLNEARNKAQEILVTTKSDARFFSQIVEKYQKYPQLLTENQYQQTLERIQDKIKEIFILSSSAKRQKLNLHFARNRDLYRYKPKEEKGEANGKD